MDSNTNKERGLFGFRVLWILGFLIILILFFAYFFYGLQPVSDVTTESTVEFKVTKGEGLKSIGGRLSRAALIKSIAVFKMYALISGKAQSFQPGLYKISPAMSVPAIVNELTSPGRNEVTVTIPEGVTVKDVDNILQQFGVLEKPLLNYPWKQLADRYPYLANVHSLEGFLFPDTYRFQFDSSAETILKIFLDNFNKKAWSRLKERENWYDYLILASYLEREVPEFEDRQIVAGILLKRLKLGMPLQVDATISYIKCNGMFKNCENIKISRDDLKLASPYNTYERLGWTPSPIANPGEAALAAALNPKASSYLYYLSAAKSKETIFSKTLEEHNINRAKFL
jgi:UPF0755 protein